MNIFIESMYPLDTSQEYVHFFRLIFHLRDCAKDCRHSPIMIFKDQTKPEGNAAPNRSHEMCGKVASRGWLNFLTGDRDKVSPLTREFLGGAKNTSTILFPSYPFNCFQYLVPIYPHLYWVLGKETGVKLYNSTSIIQCLYPRRAFYRIA